MPYICLRRTDMGDALNQGTFYVGDLTPNVGQKIMHSGEPTFGVDDIGNVEPSAYAGPIFPVATTAGSTVLTEDPGDTSGVTSAEYTGLSAFLLDNCVDGADAGTLSAADALTISTALVAEMRTNGGAMTSAAIETIIQVTDAAVTVAASEIQNAGFVAGVLRCLAGATYTVPITTEIFAAGGNATAAGGSFTAANTRRCGLITLTDSLTESIRVGQLEGFIAAGFSYLGTTAAAVVVYDDDGSVLS
jgi:hypothetical protein